MTKIRRIAGSLQCRGCCCARRRTRRAGARPARRRDHHPQARRRRGQGAEGRRGQGLRHPPRSGVPITGGSLTSGGATGTIEHSGRLKLLRRRQVADRLRSFTVKLGKRSTLSRARRQRPRHAPDARTRARRRSPAPGSTRGSPASRVALTARRREGAQRDVLARTCSSAGLRLGTVSRSRAKPKTVALTGGATTVTLDPGAAAALQSLGIAAAPIGSRLARVPDHRRRARRQDVRGHDHAQRRHRAHQGRDDASS